MNTKHTPGPWTTYVSEWPNKIEVRKLEHDQIGPAEVAHLATVISGPANARLIAAAPELLAELEKCANVISHSLSELPDAYRKAAKAQADAARAAIAKATGETI